MDSGPDRGEYGKCYDQDGSGTPRNSFNIDAGGIDAIMGSLYNTHERSESGVPSDGGNNVMPSVRSCGNDNPVPHRHPRRPRRSTVDCDGTPSTSARAIMESLYSNSEGNVLLRPRGSRSFHGGDGSNSDEGAPLLSVLRRGTRSFHDSSKSFSSLSRSNASRKTSGGRGGDDDVAHVASSSRDNDREIDGVGEQGRQPPPKATMPCPRLRRTSADICDAVDSSHDNECYPKTEQRRVSWSQNYSISVVDMAESPLSAVRMNEAWKGQINYTPLPLHKGGQTSGRGYRPIRREGHRNHNEYHANPQDNNLPHPKNGNSATSRRPRTRVISLPWTDHRGLRGEYTGEVNPSIQPHGEGTFTLEDGRTTISSTWKDGAMVSARVPLKGDGGAAPEYGMERSSKSASSSTVRIANEEDDNDEGEEEDARYSYRRMSSSSTTFAAVDDANNDNAVRDSPTPTVKSASSATSLPGYRLGVAARHRSHMRIPSSPAAALEMASSLKSLDFVFVLRSNGEWTYGIVADRRESSSSEEEEGGGQRILQRSIRFVLDGKGSTKTIREKYWDRGIRLVNPEAVGADGCFLHGAGRKSDDGENYDDANEETEDVRGAYDHIIEGGETKEGGDAGYKTGRASKKKGGQRLIRKQSIDSDQAVVDGGGANDTSANPSISGPKTFINSMGAVVEGAAIHKKMNRQKASQHMSFTSDNAVSGSFTQGGTGSSGPRKFCAGGFDEHARKVWAAGADGEASSSSDKGGLEDRNGTCGVADERESSRGALGGSFDAMLSLDYLGMLDDIMQTGENGNASVGSVGPYHQQQKPQTTHRTRKSASYVGDASVMFNSSFYTTTHAQWEQKEGNRQREGRRSSFYQHQEGSQSTTTKQGGQRKSKSSHGGGKSRSGCGGSSIKSMYSSCPSFHSTSTDSNNNHPPKKRGIMKSTSSFHASMPGRPGSKDSPLGANNVGNGVSNLEELLREIYSPEYLEKAK